MNKKKIAVLVSGGGTNLQAIYDACDSGIITNGEIALVVASKEGVYALERVKQHNEAHTQQTETAVLPRKAYADRKSYSDALRELLDNRGIDLIVLAGFMIILDESFIRAFENRIINVHPALIPSFCGDGFYGLHVHEAALAKGVKVTGATVHFVNEICDGGPIILQKAVEIEQGDTPETLQRRVMEQAEWKILPQAVELFCAERLEVVDNHVIIK
ncbi:MAG: phosphoribosylglycinamide formyltransferase [Clostridiales bacterium]|nr:phosphoribosylglycinamide formyltransferase [Clostridiales bacterium]